MKTFQIIFNLCDRNLYLQHYDVGILAIYCIFIHNTAPIQEWIDTTFSTVLPEPGLYRKLKFVNVGGPECWVILR